MKAMLESNMIEANENRMEIIEFEPKVVEKMLEFCETDKIRNFENLEEEVFKIAHKYQIKDLMVRLFGFFYNIFYSKSFRILLLKNWLNPLLPKIIVTAICLLINMAWKNTKSGVLSFDCLFFES